MLKLTDNVFIKKSESQKPATSERAAIRAAMHENAAYEQVFDLLAQAGGPNMLMDAPDNTGVDAPMADPNQVTDISDVWPEQDIVQQARDLRNQGMDDRKIFQQLVDMGVLGTPKPMAQDLEYLNQVMRTAQSTDLNDDLAPETKNEQPRPTDAPSAPMDPLDPNLSREQKMNNMMSFVRKLVEKDNKRKMLVDKMKDPKNPPAEKKALAKEITALQNMIKGPLTSIWKRLSKAYGPDIANSPEVQAILKQRGSGGMEQEGQAGTGPAGTAASPMDGQRDSLSHEEVPGTGKIQVESADPRMVRRVVVDETHKQQQDQQQQQQKLPSMQQQQDRAQEFADFMPPSNFGHQQPGKRAQAKPPAPPAGAPPAQGAPPAGPEGGPPQGPPDDMEMGEEDDMMIDDMRSLSEVMEDLSTDVEVLMEKIESGETVLDGQDAEPVHDDAGPTPSGPPKIAVDQPAKDYYEGYFGEYGKQLSEDRHASIIDIVDEVATQYKAKLTTLGVDRMASFIEARPRFDAEDGDVRFAAVNDRMLANYLFKTGMAIPDVSLVSSAFKMALHNSAQGAKVLKYAEGKMKQPKIEGKPSDWVKHDKLKDKAEDDGGKARRPAHLPMCVVETSKSGVYTRLLIEWDPDHDAAKRSDSGMEQAVISYVKGLESHKEFKDLGFLGQITIDELDVEAGQAEVHFRTMKPADAPTVVKEE